ncbi:MAG: shikimate dehydrogenase [Dehalococcoidia bacterium]
MTRIAGIIGHPVAHSLSPVFQQAAFDHSGLDVRYEAWDTPVHRLAGRVDGLRRPEVLGANVTIPHKEAVLPLLDELGDQSTRVGAVNTIVNRDGRLYGFNTDGRGFVTALLHESAFRAEGRSFLLIGAGGAARGIAFALAEARAARVAIANRTTMRAEQLARDVASVATGTVVEAVGIDVPLPTFDCIVNCTSVGMEGTGTEAKLPRPLEGARPGVLAVDIVYKPADTAFLRAARASGLRTLGGLPMLIYQGALSFELWTGMAAPVDVMFQAARRALGALPGERRRP